MTRGKQKPPARAVALHYDGESAPRLTAKGTGEIAKAIMEKARAHGVPLQENGELCALLARLELGEEIPRELYVAVAEVLAFAYWLTGRAPGPVAGGE
jgi:flagellar biosynthesis protein